jgi:hypothetical protein
VPSTASFDRLLPAAKAISLAQAGQRRDPCPKPPGIWRMSAKTNSERIHRLDEPDRSPPVTWHCDMVKRVADTTFPRFLRALTLAFAVTASAATPSLGIAAGETPAEFIQTLGKDLLAEMRSAASLDQKEAYFRQMLRQDFDMDENRSFCSWPLLAHREPGAAARVPSPPRKSHHALPR